MYLILTLLLAFMASLLLTFGWLKLAIVRHWFDIPNQRSSHSKPVPKSGGIGFSLVYIVLLVSLYFSGYVPQPWFLMLGTGLLLMLTGLVDDLVELGIVTRLGFQLLTVVAALYFLPTLPDLPFPGYALNNSLLLGLLVVSAWIWLINLYNFMDGIDALAAFEAIFVALALAWFAAMSGASALSYMSVLLAVVLAGFLFFNLPPARLFMGDSGSNFLGFILGALGLLAVTTGTMTLWTLLILLGVFVVDSTVTLIKRIWAGLVWYHGHRSHAYQQAAICHGSHAKVVFGVCCLNVIWLLPLAWLSTLYVEYGLLFTLLAWAPLWLVVNHYQNGKI